MITEFLAEMYRLACKHDIELDDVVLTLPREMFQRLKMEAQPALVAPIMNFKITHGKELTYHGIKVKEGSA